LFRSKEWIALISTAFLLLIASKSLYGQAQKIRISLSSRSNTNTSYYVAQAKGLFKDEGLEVEFIQINPRLGAMIEFAAQANRDRQLKKSVKHPPDAANAASSLFIDSPTFILPDQSWVAPTPVSRSIPTTSSPA
jgi:hypothetical protein